MTSYVISLGYNSNGRVDFGTIKDAALEFCEEPERIVAEALEYGAAEKLSIDSLREYANAYKVRKDMTIVFTEDRITQYASGGYPHRDLREHLCRAFCRLMLGEMHMRGIEINVNVG